MIINPEQVSTNIEQLIRMSGKTAKDISDELGINKSTISRYISQNKIPDPQNLVKISEYFRVTIEWILGVGKDNQITVTEEAKKILELYNVASQSDKDVIMTLLKKYDMQ